MLENTTVTLSLSDFDILRRGEKWYREIASSLSHCFEYKCEEHDHPDPPECKECHGDMNCRSCEVYAKNPDYTETLTVDVERLIRTAKEYALYGKEIEADIDDLEVVPLKGEQ